MAVSTCFILADRTLAESIRRTVEENAGSFETVVAHTASEARRVLDALKSVAIAILDGHVADNDIFQRVRQWVDGPVIVLADTDQPRFEGATAVLPRDFTPALAVALRREMAKQHSGLRKEL